MPTYLNQWVRRLDRPGACLTVAAVVYAVFILARLAAHGFDPSAFVMAGDAFCDAAETPQCLTILPNSQGFDGQFYFRLALDPFTGERRAHGILLDAPAHRHQRFIFPFLAWALSLGGRAGMLPAVLIAINYFGICLVAYLGGKYARAFGRHALWGLVFPLFPGFVLSLARDCTEIVSASFVLGGLLAARRGKYAATAVLLSLAILTRETTLLVAGAVMLTTLHGWWQSRRVSAPTLALAALPLCVYIVWQLILRQVWGISPLEANSGSLEMPLVGVAKFLQAIIPPAGRHDVVNLAELALIGLLAILSASALRSSTASPSEKLAWIPYVVLVLMFGYERLWCDDWNFVRILTEFYMLGMVILLGARTRMRLPVALCWAILWLYFFILHNDLPRLILPASA